MCTPRYMHPRVLAHGSAAPICTPRRLRMDWKLPGGRSPDDHHLFPRELPPAGQLQAPVYVSHCLLPPVFMSCRDCFRVPCNAQLNLVRQGAAGTIWAPAWCSAGSVRAHSPAVSWAAPAGRQADGLHQAGSAGAAVVLPSLPNQWPDWQQLLALGPWGVLCNAEASPVQSALRTSCRA